jgi:adenylate kinase
VISPDETLGARSGEDQLNNLGRQAQTFLEKGELVPDKIMIELIKVRLHQSDLNFGWILEGYPQTVFQAEALDLFLADLGQNLDWAIYLQVPEAVIVSRFLGFSRSDEQSEIIQQRVELFYDSTIPILEYYDRRRRLLTINGDQPPAQVQENIMTLLSVA